MTKTFTINGVTYKQIQKRTAQNLFKNGNDIYLMPCRAKIGSEWIKPCLVKESDKDFEQINNNFIYYNCNCELGKYPNYYVIL